MEEKWPIKALESVVLTDHFLALQMAMGGRAKDDKRQQDEWYDRVKTIEDIFHGIEVQLSIQVLIHNEELHRLEDNAQVANCLLRGLIDEDDFRTTATPPLLARAFRMEFKCAAICNSIGDRQNAFYDKTTIESKTKANKPNDVKTKKQEDAPKDDKADNKEQTELKDECEELFEREEAWKRAIASKTLNLADYRGPSCKMCNQRHPLFRCPNFLSRVLWYRWEFVTEKNICRNCLRYFCRHNICADEYCYKCDEPHNRTLCPQRRENF